MGVVPWLVMENPLPVTLRFEIWIAEELRFTTETVALAVLPTFTEPKLTLVGETSMAPVMAPAATEVPPQPESARGNNAAIKRNATENQPLPCGISRWLDAPRDIRRA